MGRAFEYRRAAKEKRWAKMSRVFPKLARAITIAAKEGGSDPAMNPALRLAIQNAKGHNMPKDKVEAAISRAEGKDADQYVEMRYEGKGPHGLFLILECATDNPNRTVAHLRVILNKAGGSMVPSGSIEFLFERKAVIELELGAQLKAEELELQLIDHGLEEFQLSEEGAMAIGDYASFKNLTAAIESMDCEIKNAQLEMVPTQPIQLDESQREEVDQLIDALEDEEDVQSVFTNIQ